MHAVQGVVRVTVARRAPNAPVPRHVSTVAVVAGHPEVADTGADAPVAGRPHAAPPVASHPHVARATDGGAPEAPDVGASDVVAGGPGVAGADGGAPAAVDPVAVGPDVPSDPHHPRADAVWTPEARNVGVAIPVRCCPRVPRARVPSAEAGDPVARLCAVAGLIRVLFGGPLPGIGPGLLARVPLRGDIPAVFVGARRPAEALALGGAPEAKLPDAIVAAIAGLPAVAVGCDLFGDEVVVDPGAVLGVAGVLPEEALLLLLAPEALDHVTIRPDASLLPDVVRAGPCRVGVFVLGFGGVDVILSGGRDGHHRGERGHRQGGGLRDSQGLDRFHDGPRWRVFRD